MEPRRIENRAPGGPGARVRARRSAALCLIALLGCSRAPASPRAGPPVARLESAPSLGELADLDPAARALVERTRTELGEDPDRAERWSQLGAVLQAHGRFQDARTCYGQSLLRSDTDAHTWYLLAVVRDELGDGEGALEGLERCVTLDPGYPPAHVRLGLLRLGRGELDRAEAELRAALSVSPHDAAAVVGLARVDLARNRFADAASVLEEHLRRLPADGNARLLLGSAYRGLGRLDDAARVVTGSTGAEPIRHDPWLEEVLSLRQGFRTDFLHAVELLDHGQVDAALPLLEDLRARRPEDVLVLVGLHRALRKKGELERAIDLLVEARRLDPLLDVVHLHLAGAYQERAHRAGTPPDRTDLESALAESQVACELSPTFPEAQGMLGGVLGDLGRSEEAAEAYGRAAELGPDTALWQEKAGLSLTLAGHWAEAVAPLRRLNALRPGSPQVLLRLAAALANSGHLDEARTFLDQARVLAPEDPAIRKASADLDLARTTGPR